MPGLDAALAAASRYIEANILVDTVRITGAATGAPVLNETTGQLEYPTGAVLYEGPGAVQADSPVGSAVPAAGQPWVQETASRYRLLTPLSAPIAPKDATVTVTAVHNAANSALVGRTWVCLDPSQASTLEAVRITPLDQNQAPRAVTP